MKVPFFDSTREYAQHKIEFDSAVEKVMTSGSFILGKDVADFEDKIKQYTGAKYAIGVANGSDALIIASDILGYKNAEVLTPAFTFFSSASCIARVGGKPVFCDIDADTYCIDMQDAESRITKKTQGIIPVHLFLQTADMDKCLEIAKNNSISILEDAAEAFGMQRRCGGKIKHSGTMGDFGVFSFFPTKTLGGYGDGGMIITNNDELYQKAKSYRVHGAAQKYYHDYVGYNSRLDTLQAAVLNVKMKIIDCGIEKRASHAAQYHSLLQNIHQIKLPVVLQNNKEVYYVFCIQAEKRDALAEFLKQNEIGTSIYYPVPLHLQKCFSYLGYRKGDFPVAEMLCEKVLALPMFPELTENEISYVCEKIQDFYKK
ncbi:MAG: DegT/DnrJ/EryC1/StrS family aminotransferase [Termitinemataceae bacterium]|nr:MAG: DegT/DnrJ/EryC1/StrS family aminotransferase [Termitinemataceae bacterium]